MNLTRLINSFFDKPTTVVPPKPVEHEDTDTLYVWCSVLSIMVVLLVLSSTIKSCNLDALVNRVERLEQRR